MLFRSQSTQVLFVNFGERESQVCLGHLARLRSAGVRAEIYPEPAKMKKQMEYANRRGIPFVVIVGEDELASRHATVKEMHSGEQQTVPFDKLSEYMQH